MARQQGVIPFEGTIGGIIFYRNKHGYLARSKGGIPARRIATEERFARTRETGSEFGYASRLGKLLRLGVKACCPATGDSNTNFRVAAELMKIVQQDAVHARGQRRLTGETAHLLEGFAWNEKVRRVPVDISLDTDMARCSVTGGGPPLPAGATHMVLTLAVIRVDGQASTQTAAYAQSDMIGRSGTGAELRLRCALPEGSGDLLMAGLGLEAFQEVNGVKVSLQEGCGFWVGKVVML